LNDPKQANQETHNAWEANAAHWDNHMGTAGNDFVNRLVWPATKTLLDIRPGERVLDIACGNGLYALRLADLGASVTGFDFSAALIDLARQHARLYGEQIELRVIDATDRDGLLSLGEGQYEAAVCNMALFDMAEIAPLAETLPRLLTSGGRFVFSVMHPAFNGMHAGFLTESFDDGENLVTRYYLKLSGYLTSFAVRGIALRNQPKPQLYFHRPLNELLRPFLAAGFVLDALEEPAFPPDNRPERIDNWSGNYSEFPPVLIARLRHKR
jgi:2-polyprenyl-3-methyl-5-hydroxy-6-metoxy-1,4-benzoquinol methylase